jgi:branched-chain amino acid transport system ATP-binding protein
MGPGSLSDAVPELSVNGLQRRFRGVAAVDGLSFDVASGTVSGLIGPNGCGKTTAIDCITGFQAPDGGSVQLGGRTITGLPPHRLAKAGLVRTFQSTAIYPALTLLDHFLLGRQEFDGCGLAHALVRTPRLRRAERDATERARELLRLVRLDRYEQAPAMQLSYGQCKLLALAISLVNRPRIVLLDEPLAGVNPAMIDRIAETVELLNAEGQTFLIVEHNFEFVARCCHVVNVMESGRLLTSGSPTVVRADPRVLEAYFGTRPADVADVEERYADA